MEKPILKNVLSFIKNQLNIEAFCAIENNKYVSFPKNLGCFVGII